jgi:hypothetical protein
VSLGQGKKKNEKSKVTATTFETEVQESVTFGLEEKT